VVKESYFTFTMRWPFKFKSFPEIPFFSYLSIHSVNDSVTFPLGNFALIMAAFSASLFKVAAYCSGEIPSGT